LLPLIALAVTESAGVTHLFRRQQATHDPNPPGGGPTPVVVPKQDPRPVQVAKPDPLPPTYKNRIGMEFVIVPKGKSWLGGGKDNLGTRRVEIPADFYLGRYEVTQEEWEKVMGENPSHFSRTGGGRDAVKDISDADLKRFPVERVSWDDCQIFVAKLNQREKESGWVYRLPTSTEWEYACRGGPMLNKTDSAFDFYFAKPTNNLLLEKANFGSDEGLKRTSPVAHYEANRLGLFNMHGNVWEWCNDPEIEINGTALRVLLGGAWTKAPERCTARFRDPCPSRDRIADIGLRLARVRSDAPSPEAKTPPATVGPFTDDDVKRIASLPPAEQVKEVGKELMRRNPRFDGTLTPTIEDSVVTGLQFLTDEVDNIAPVRALKGLVSLDCNGTYPNKGKLSDLSPLKGMSLKQLNCRDTQVADLTVLTGMPLTSFFCSNTRVSDLTPLRDMALVELHCVNTGVRDLSPLKGMRLRELQAQAIPASDLTPLQGMPLKHLDLYGTVGVTSLQPLQGMPLEYLNLAQLPVSDLSPLKGMTSLRRLILHDMEKLSDLAPLKGIPLTALDLQDCRAVRDLEPLKGMPLTRLLMFNTAATDLRPLQGMALEEIRLTPRNITQGLQMLRDLGSLKTIGIDYSQPWPAAEFWERYGKGEFK
jgi:formylglycine-generating enzyme required for sulfatase activity